MCCFSVASPAGAISRLFAKKVHVSKTNIFARMLDATHQALAYGMDLESDFELAMILPLPVAPGSGEDAVQFVDLSATPRMFPELAELFDFPEMQSRGGPRLFRQKGTLAVHDVGAFIASYVPGRSDFSRLDPRF